MKIEYSNHAKKFIASQDRNTKERIKSAIENLTKMPAQGDIKLLQGYKIKTYRLRIGKYRIVYRYDIDTDEHRILFISDIDSRGNIY